MPPLDNPRHERFAQNVAKGLSQSEAYRKVYGAEKIGARQQAAALMKDHDISARVMEISALLTNEFVMSQQELNEFLTKVIRTPLDGLDETSPLIQSVKYTEGSREFKLVPKLGAAELLAKSMRWLEAPQTNINVGVAVNVTTSEERNEIMKLRQAALEGR